MQISSFRMQNLPEEIVKDDIDTLDEVLTSARVILFNDDWHTFDEVIDQIMKAINCSYDHAETLTLEVHHHGKSAVFEGDINECLKVSSILEEIGLHTQIEY